MIYCSSQKYVFLIQFTDYLSKKGTLVPAIFTKYKFLISRVNMHKAYCLRQFCILLYVLTFEIIKYAYTTARGRSFVLFTILLLISGHERGEEGKPP